VIIDESSLGDLSLKSAKCAQKGQDGGTPNVVVEMDRISDD
jgi:hypothetical protein